MAIGDQVGTQAAQDISAGLNQAVTTLAGALDKFTATIAPFLAEADGDIVGALDRLRTDLVTESQAWDKTVNRALDIVERFSLKDHL